MNGPTGTIIKAMLATKLAHVQQAVQSYAHDRLDQGRGMAKGYAVGAGLYAAAGLFLIAAIFVGAVALFRWIEAQYGSNIAFGSIGGGLVILALVCALCAAGAMRPPKKNLVSLSSRLRVAMRVNPKAPDETPISGQTYAPLSGQDALAAARNTAASVLRGNPRAGRSAAIPSQMTTRAGAALAVSLLGWALARRYSQPRRPAGVPQPKP